VVEEDRPHIVQMAIERKQTPPCLVRPDLDLVVVPTRDKEGLRFVEVNASYWAVVLFEAIDQCAHAVVPQLNCGGVEGDEDPWPGAMSVLHSTQTLWGKSHLLGWKAIPFALEDLDSNYSSTMVSVSRGISRHLPPL